MRPLSPLQENAEQCAQAVMEAVPPVMRFIRSEMRRHGSPALSLPQFRALAFVHRHPGSSLSAVADHLGVTRATASSLVERLVQQGLIDRVDDPGERRRHCLTLNPPGIRLLQTARMATHDQVAAVLGRLSSEQLHAVALGIALLGQAFSEVNAEHATRRV